MLRVLVVLLCLAGLPSRLDAQDPVTAAPAPVLQEVRLEGATVYKQEDVVWLLRLREGAPLTRDAAAIAKALQERYERDGYGKARVTGTFQNGRLTLTVDEGRIDDIELLGVPADHIARYRRLLGIEPGDIYNTRVIGRSTARLTSRSGGAVSIGRPKRDQPGGERGETMPDEVTLERRGARNVLVVPVRYRYVDSDGTIGSGREDLFSPADGLSPAIGYSATIFDHGRFNHTFVEGYVAYKFGRDEPGYSVGLERPLFGGPRLFLGAETHDITASDDLWRLSSFEQTFVSLAFKNSFRDYYRRRGNQVFGVLRAGGHHEINLMARWDRHEPLPNATSYSFFRDDAELRPPLPVVNQRVNAFVIGYTFDTRPLTSAGNRSTYSRHLKDSLYGFGTRQAPGLRLEWTSEIAGHGLGGDAKFDRHIVNARGHVPISRHSLLSMRGLFGFSGGTVPVERVFSLGGIGSVHGYSFKEVSGTKMSLLNAEYRVNFGSSGSDSRHDAPNVFVFYDAGRVFGTATSTRWLQGTGVGFGAAGVRIEFGFRTDDMPNSRQILVRFSPGF
jgi:hypothetical protein